MRRWCRITIREGMGGMPYTQTGGDKVNWIIEELPLWGKHQWKTVEDRKKKTGRKGPGEISSD